MFDKLVTKASAIDTKVPSTSGLIFKKQYDSNKQNLEKKIEDIDKEILSGLVKKTDYNTKNT